jgi:hypothetical protein
MSSPSRWRGLPASASLSLPLTSSWQLLTSEEGAEYFYDSRTGETVWAEPEPQGRFVSATPGDTPLHAAVSYGERAAATPAVAPLARA